MNISFFDGVNDGKFYSINAGKYDELGEEDIDISTEVEEDEEDDVNTCINRFSALEKDVSKIHMNLNNLRNEFKGSCKDWNDLSDTVDHMLNNIAELRTIMNRADDRLNKRLNVISEANVVLTDKLSLVEKKLEVFKCIDILDRVTKLEERYETGIITFNELRDKLKKLDIDVTSNMENNMDKVNDRMGIIEKKFAMFYDILDRVTKLEEQIKPTVLEEAKELEANPSAVDDILDRLKKLEEDRVSTQLQIANVVSKDIRDDVRLHSIDLKLKKLEDTKCDKVSPSVADDILNRLGKLEESCDADGKLIGNLGRRIVDTDCNLSSLSDRVSKLDSKLAVTAKIVENRVPFIKDKLGPKTESIVEDLKKQIGRSQIEPGKNDIQDDSVNHPKHYTDGKYECIDFIEEYGMVTHVGNAIKYISRNGKKDTSKYAEDLNKAFWYLHRYNTPQSMGHIDVADYCHEKKLPMELADVIIAISQEDYKRAEKKLGNYIVKLTGKPPKALEDEQSK